MSCSNCYRTLFYISSQHLLRVVDRHAQSYTDGYICSNTVFFRYKRNNPLHPLGGNGLFHLCTFYLFGKFLYSILNVDLSHIGM